MPIVDFNGSDALIDLAVLSNENDGNEIKPSPSLLNLSRNESNPFHRSHLDSKEQQEPEDDIISAITNPSIYPGHGRKNTDLSTSHHSSQFHSSFAMAFSNVIMRRGSECAGTTSTSSLQQQKKNKSQQESYEELQDKVQELQKENEELKKFSEQAIKCINDLTEKQIALQTKCQKEIDDAKETTDMYKRQQDEHLMNIKLLTHEKEELEKELKKLRNPSWNKMSEKINSSRLLDTDEIGHHRRSLSDESSLNSNVNHLTTHTSINATGKFPETNLSSNITPCTTASTAIASDNQSFINSISEEQHQAFNDICDKYLFDRSTNNSSFRSKSSTCSTAAATPSIITTSRGSRPVSSYTMEHNSINTIQEDLFYDSDDTSSWGAKQLQRRVAAMQRNQRNNQPINNKNPKHSTTFYKGQNDDDEMNLLNGLIGPTTTTVKYCEDDDSDVRTLQFDEQKRENQQSVQQQQVEPPQRNILDHVPIIAIRNKNNSNNNVNDTNKPRRPSISRYATNINPASWLSRPSAISHTLERKNKRNLRIGRA